MRSRIVRFATTLLWFAAGGFAVHGYIRLALLADEYSRILSAALAAAPCVAFVVWMAWLISGQQAEGD